MSLRKPVRFRILDLDISVAEKQYLLSSTTDKNFLRLIETVEKIPFGAYVSTYESLTKFDKIKQLRDTLNTAVIGHEAEKLKLIRNISRGCPSDPNRPIIIGIRGPKGVGRGRLIEAIANAMDKDIVRLDLRDCRVPGYLDGRIDKDPEQGAIVSGLQSTECMDPLFRFDNVDIVNSCDQMSEIDKAILWMTDGKRNDKFRDKFVGDIDIDVSKCTFVFTYESRLAIHPSLLNRMIEIDLSRYSFTQKLSIVEERVLPEILLQFSMCSKSVDIVSDIAFIKSCIDACSDAPGVYEVKRLMSIVCEELEVAYTMGDSIPDVHEIVADHLNAKNQRVTNMMYT
jgi:ATP-dependent Lon protease